MGAPNATAKIAIEKARRETDSIIEKINKLFDNQWVEYRKQVEVIKYSLFKDWDKL
jgi:hypothetical protein